MEPCMRLHHTIQWQNSDGECYILKPDNFEQIFTIKYRIKAAWNVFTGKCAPIEWFKRKELPKPYIPQPTERYA